MPIKAERLLATFRTLLKIDSPPRKEEEIANYVRAELARLGAQAVIDNVGNVIGRFDGSGEPVLLNAHLDTVMPTAGLKVVESDDYWLSDGATILGADDKAGVAVILEVLRAAKENGDQCPPIEVVFTVSEEIGLLGAKGLDFAAISAKRGVCLDSAGPVGTIIVAGPGQISLDITVTGRAAHAGIAPEKGISAIVVAAEAIARLKWGRIDFDTTANVGVIQGGAARNIVPDKASVLAEARSRDESKLLTLVQQIRRSFERAAARRGALVQVDAQYEYRAFSLSENDAFVRAVCEAAERVGVRPSLNATGGGSDTNIFNEHGIKMVNLGVGYEDPHSPNERIAISDLVKSAQLLHKVLNGLH